MCSTWYVILAILWKLSVETRSHLHCLCCSAAAVLPVLLLRNHILDKKDVCYSINKAIFWKSQNSKQQRQCLYGALRDSQALISPHIYSSLAACDYRGGIWGHSVDTAVV